MLQFPAMLITDDDRDFRETLREVFQRRGFRTWLAGDGPEALEVVQRETVHVALFDMHMPRLSGLETMRRVKHIHHRLPCILISAALDERLAEEARRANAYHVLSKPVRCGEIMEVVRSALQATYGSPPGGEAAAGWVTR